MFRFSIRDLMWLTVVVATASYFWNDHSKLRNEQGQLEAVRTHALLLRGELILARNQYHKAGQGSSVDWKMADEAIP